MPEKDAQNDVSSSTQSADAETNRIVEMRLPVDSVAMADTLRAVPEMVIEIEQLVPTYQSTLPNVWATGANFERFEAAAADDPTVERLQIQADTDSGRLYRTEWVESETELLQWMKNAEVTVLQSEVNGENEEWHFEFRFPSRDGLDAFQSHCDERGVQFDLVRLFELSAAKMGQYNMNEKQYETILTAMEMGYYEIPRSVTLEEVAEELGISSGAVSERLRRGQTTLVNNSLRIGQPTGIGVPDKSEGA